MNKLLVQWVLVISSIILAVGCSSGGSVPDEEESEPFFDPLPSGLPSFAEINEPYLKPSSNNPDALSLFSYKTPETSTDLSEETEVLSASSNIIVSLNTDEDDSGESEYTLMVRNDSVYLVNHDSNEIRLLSHFVNKVCEVIPVETVSEKLNESGTEKIMTVLHDELVYVMTAEPSDLADDCISDSKKRFYELPLDHQLDPSEDEDGELESLVLVKESKARAELIFGWVEDPADMTQDVMTYGYLGYADSEKELSLYDKNKDLVWTQDRSLQHFEQVAIAPETLSEKYIFHVQALESEQYLIQLGLDVFVIDSGNDLLSKTFNEIETVLSDKTMSVDLRTKLTSANTSVTYAQPVEAIFDADDLLLIDNAKIHRLAYKANLPTRNPDITTRIVPQNPKRFDGVEHLTRYGFSQFDLESCASDDADCIQAHDVEAQTWQFLTRCEEQYGCTELVSTEDLCETWEEKLQSQSDAPLCSVSDYRHLAELNKPDNDAELIAYMQYVENYTHHMDYILHKNRLFITAKMEHKDVFLAYDFNQSFSAPKALREQVFFGERASLTGMDAYFSNDNLFLTALQKGALRSNECYKNGQKVGCDLGELNEAGGISSCTGKDLADGLCTNQFYEYESKAIFCTSNQITDFSCSDAALSQLGDLAVESEDEDAKWLPVYHYPSDSYVMYLLVGDHVVALDTGNLDEGKLYSPALYTIDLATGQKDELLTELDGTVELVVDAWLTKNVSLGVAEVFGRINIISDEINQVGSMQYSQSKLTTYLLEQTYEDSLADIPELIKATTVSERLFDRL